MLRSRFALAVLVLLAAPAASHAATSSVDIPSYGPYVGGWAGPVFTADGGVVAAVQQSAGEVNILRVAPGTTRPQKVTSVSVPTVVTHGGAWTGVGLTLMPAGQGFFLYQEKQGGEVHCCDWHAFDPKLTWFATPAAAGTDVPLCETGTCTDCGYVLSPAVGLAGDATNALVIPRCRDSNGTSRRPFVRDLATGVDHPLDYPTGTGDDRLAGRFVSYCCPYNVGPPFDVPQPPDGHVIDWQTGETLRTVANMSDHALLDDGTVIYNFHGDETSPWDQKVRRWDSGAAAPVDLPQVRGAVQAVTGGRLLTIENQNGPHFLDVWTLTGEPIASLPLPANFNAVAFDGLRAAYFDPGCTTVRLQIWDIGTAAPPRPACGPVTVGSIELNDTRARLEVTCPARVTQGCTGSVSLRSPRPPRPRSAAFRLNAGQHRWVPLATRLSAQRCRALARTHTWRATVSYDTTYSQKTRTMRRHPAVAC